MHQVIQLIYIAAIMMGVIPFAMQTMISAKNLETDNRIAKSKNTSLFLALIVVFNVCDFLIIFLQTEIGEGSIAWIYIIENVLEVALAYALIAMEGEYVDAPMKKWFPMFFAVMATVILWSDTLYTTGILLMQEQVYMALMICLNMIPVAVVAYFCIGYMRRGLTMTRSKVAYAYLVIYNLAFLFLCIMVTISIIDSRTSWDYFKNDKELCVIFWLIFNILNAGFIMHSCQLVAMGSETAEESIDEKIEKISLEYGLSSREKEIALLLYKGRNNSEIAEQLFLSTNTIKVHASNLYRKLGVSNRVQAVKVIRGENMDE